MMPKPLQSVAGLNPMTGVVEAFRWCLFGGQGNWQTIGLSGLSILLLGVGALLVFRHLEADLAERA
jgi:ABC-type polysaccharide/polyol phosphate export permease